MIGQTVSHYIILEKLGEGGMGVVYKAEDTKLKRTVALKFLSPELTQEKDAKTRFIHEAQAASSLQHHNICTIHEIDETKEGQLFIAMDCYEGETLKAKIAERPLPVDAALNIAIQVNEGLSKAHEAGMVHRDIKPANIVLTKDGLVKILDFGLAKLAGMTKVTKTGTTVGTVAYMSPEQAKGEEVDHRSDIWSLGAVLYEMVTGQLPFKGDHEQAVVYNIVHVDPEPMTGLRTGVPMEMERIVGKAMAKKPGERYQHIKEMLVDLKLIRKKLEAEAWTQRPIREKLLPRKWIFLFGGAAILVALIIIGRLILFTERDEAIDSIAVLPLENLMGDPEQEYFVDGMTEALIADLAQIRALHVISRTSVMQYKGARKPLPDIARELNVDAVVEGSVLRAGEQVRITVQLIHAPTDRHLWAEKYERELRDILVLQNEVARAIAREIEVKLTPEEESSLASARFVDPDAHEAYLKGRYHWAKYEKQAVWKALEYFENAIERDSTYAPAYAGIAVSWVWLGQPLGAVRHREAMPKAKAAAKKALELDDELGETHAILGAVRYMYDWNWPEAEREFKRSLDLNPNSALSHQLYGFFLIAMERHEEAISHGVRALEIDPLSLTARSHLAEMFFAARRFDRALGEYQKVLDMDPGYARAIGMMIWINEVQGKYEEAIELCREGMKHPSLPYDEAFVSGLGEAYADSGSHGYWKHKLKANEEEASEGYVPPETFARIYAALGEKDAAFEWLERAYEERVGSLVFLKGYPGSFDNLHSDPRFAALLEKIGLEP